MFSKISTILQLLSIGTSATLAQNCSSLPSSIDEFSGSFQQPLPPILRTEFQTGFVQHKWNTNLSHITSGYIEHSAAKKFVRVDEASEEGLASSIFDHSNQTADGLVNNILTTYGTNSTNPHVWSGYVLSNFPTFQPEILLDSSAVFMGLVTRPFFENKVSSWGILYMGQIPTTIYTTEFGILAGYDYFSPGLRTRVVTEFFNIRINRSDA